MANIVWDESLPVGSSYLSDLAPLWRSVKTSVDAALRDHFYWSDSTSSAGEPRFSTTTPGSCRAYYGPRSAVSTPGRVGSLMLVSDEWRLLVFADSGESVVVGSRAGIVSYRDSVATAAHNVRWVSSSSTFDASVAQVNSITYGFTYDAPPMVTLGGGATTSASAGSYVFAIVPGGGDEKSGFSATAQYIGAGPDPSEARLFWYSEGTIAL